MAGRVIRENDVERWGNRAGNERFVTTVGGSGEPVDGVRAGWYRLAAGTSNPPDVHTVHEMYFIHQGEAQIVLDGEVHRMGPGDTVVVPPGCHHQITNDGDEELVLVFLFAPPPPVRGPDDPPSDYVPLER